MGHIKTNERLHLTEVFILLKSFNRYFQSAEDKPSQTSSSFFKNNWFLGLNSVDSNLSATPSENNIVDSNLSATPSENNIVWAYVSCLRSKQIQQTQARDNPCLYGILRSVWHFPGLYGDLQTGFEPIKLLDT